MKTITDIKNEAHAVLFKFRLQPQFQTGKYTREDVYEAAVNLVLSYNNLVENSSCSEDEIEEVAGLLMLLKHISK
ncbi:hypothetical protein DVF32_25295 [Salmonella enterica subsp. diarizonae]|nr:hypothetical protein [Salmonella enterica subsp. diarizonae]